MVWFQVSEDNVHSVSDCVTSQCESCVSESCQGIHHYPEICGTGTIPINSPFVWRLLIWSFHSRQDWHTVNNVQDSLFIFQSPHTAKLELLHALLLRHYLCGPHWTCDTSIHTLHLRHKDWSNVTYWLLVFVINSGGVCCILFFVINSGGVLHPLPVFNNRSRSRGRKETGLELSH